MTQPQIEETIRKATQVEEAFQNEEREIEKENSQEMVQVLVKEGTTLKEKILEKEKTQESDKSPIKAKPYTVEEEVQQGKEKSPTNEVTLERYNVLETKTRGQRCLK